MYLDYLIKTCVKYSGNSCFSS